MESDQTSKPTQKTFLKSLPLELSKYRYHFGCVFFILQLAKVPYN